MLDYTRDKNPGWLRAVNGAMPDWVKDAPHPSEDELVKMSSATFADPLHRLHPLHTPAAAFSSLAYLLANGASAESPEVQTAKTAAAKWEIEQAELDALIESVTVHIKSAAADAPEVPLVAMTVKNAAGDADGFYDISTVGQMMESAEQLARDYSDQKIPALWAKEACANIKSAADARGVPLSELHPLVKHMNDERVHDFARARELVGFRKYARVSTADVETYRDIVNSVEHEEVSVEEGVEMMEALDQAHLVKYAGLQTDPWTILNSGHTQDEIVKMADSSVLMADTIVPAHVIAHIPEETVRMRFAKSAADQVWAIVKTASVAPTDATVLAGNLEPDVQRGVLALALQMAGGLPAPA